MAVARHVQVPAADDGFVAVQRDIIDPQSGTAAEVEKVTVVVDKGEGKVAVLEQARLEAVALPNVSWVVHLNTLFNQCMHFRHTRSHYHLATTRPLGFMSWQLYLYPPPTGTGPNPQRPKLLEGALPFASKKTPVFRNIIASTCTLCNV